MTDWIEWNGGECPVTHDAYVEVRFRGGDHVESDTAATWYWDHDGYSYDIVAYRVLEND